MEKISHNPEETQLIGADFSSQISQGDIIAINGIIGAGKTTFIKGILKGFGYKGNVSSPTYTLINEYDSSNKIIHIDCYRESTVKRWLDIGIMDYLNGNNIVIIEWADKMKTILPSDTFKIVFKHIKINSREIIFYNQ